MKLSHIALWTTQLEELREFYTTYFDGRSGEKYVNPAKGFESYFIHFSSGAALEIMRSTAVTDKSSGKPSIGLCHMAFETSGKEEVNALTERFREDGYRVVSEPRTTGDGFYESSIADPDGNLVEIIA